MKDRIVAMILEALRALLLELDHPSGLPVSPETRLFGEKGVLDSLGLVRLLADVEEQIGNELALDLVLADDRAMSQTKSPFRRVNTLAEYIVARIEERRANE